MPMSEMGRNQSKPSCRIADLNDYCLADEPAFPEEKATCGLECSDGFLPGQENEPYPSRLTGLQWVIAEEQQGIPCDKGLASGDHDRTPIARIYRSLPTSVLSSVDGDVSGQLWLGFALDVDAAHAIRLEQSANVCNGSICDIGNGLQSGRCLQRKRRTSL